MEYGFDDIPEQALAWHQAGLGAVLATVVETWGSAPRRVGSQLVVNRAGDIAGSVSGGCVEGAVIVEALERLETGGSSLLEFGVSDDDAFAVGLACGGRIRVLVEPVGDEIPEALLGALVAARAARRAVAYVVNCKKWTRHLMPLEKAETPEIEGRFRSDKSGFDSATFYGVHNPPLRMIIVGAVHIAQPLTVMARLAGYDPYLIDPRETFANTTRFPGEEIATDWPDDALQAIGIDERTAVITLSHDPKIDDPALAVALQSSAFYVGALGSTRTHAKRVARFESNGMAKCLLDRLHAPVGLNLGSATPAEIAISVIAEITQVLRQGA